MKYFIFPYVQNSNGAKEIAAELEGKRILREGSNYKPKQDHLIINWGASDCPFKEALNYNNKAVLDKLAFFKRLEGTGLTPYYATTKTGAASALKFPIFCRTKLQGRDGAGIVIADSAEQLVSAPLYVEGIDKTNEYRIHVGRLPDGTVEIIGGQKKIKKAATPEMTNIPPDHRIWCGDVTGLVWTVNGHPVYLPPCVIQVVTKAFEKFPELTFGGFDVVYDQNTSAAYVIEINSAPMVTPETRRLYGKFFRRYAEQVSSSDAELANLPDQGQGEQHPLGSSVLQPVATEVAPAAPVSQPEVKEAALPQTQTKTTEEVLADFINGNITVKTLAEGYLYSQAQGAAADQAKAKVVELCQEIINYVQQ